MGDSSEGQSKAKQAGPRAARLAGSGAGEARSPACAGRPELRVQASRAGEAALPPGVGGEAQTHT